MKNLIVPLLSFLLAIFIGGLLLAFSDSKVLDSRKNFVEMFRIGASKAWSAYAALFQGAIYDSNLASQGGGQGFYPLSETLVVSGPLILSGLAVALAFRAGLFNIGAQGQFIFGAIGASYVGFTFDLPIVVHVIVAIAFGTFLGGLWGGIAGILKARTGAHEVIVTIMLNYVAANFILWLLKTDAFLREGRTDPIAPEVLPNSRLPRFFGEEFRVSAAILVALLVAWLVSVLLDRTTWGYQFKAVGANSTAAKTAGMSVPFVMTSVMIVCGAIAGLGGAVNVLGAEYALTTGIAGSFGFDAITVALLGRAKPLGVVFSAFLFAGLRVGGQMMQARTETPLDLILIVQALIILFIAAPALVKGIFRLKNVSASTGMAAKGWNG
ncbi:MAG: ABC transporter permease [Actinomycetota bacterium]